MNYFAHGREHIDSPYFLAGTAVPDWLNVVNRKANARERLAAEFVDHEDPQVAAVARGIVQHHQDDAWFHAARAFSDLSMEFTITIRDLLPRDDGFRPSFLGHILVELLLDAALIEDDPPHLDRYYAAMESFDAQFVGAAVNRMVTRPVDGLSSFIPKFTRSRFLCDYLDNDSLLRRVNNVMDRVKLPQLPTGFVEFFPAARSRVKDRKTELLTYRGAS